MTRWLVILTFAFGVLAGVREADAQVFKPRGKAGATKPAKKTETKTAKAAPTTKKAARTAPAKGKKSRPADSGRPSDLTPASAKKGKAGKDPKSRRGEDEDEVASAGGDDEVIITDDED